MKQLFKIFALVATILLLGTGIASAHHSFSMFNQSVEQVKTGTVERWAFNNPHSWLYITVTDDDGSETLWSFEASAPPRLVTRGITGSTFEPGDKVTVLFCPLVDGRTGGGLGWVMLENGIFLDPSDGGCDGSDENIARWKPLLAQGILSTEK